MSQTESFSLLKVESVYSGSGRVSLLYIRQPPPRLFILPYLRVLYSILAMFLSEVLSVSRVPVKRVESHLLVNTNRHTACALFTVKRGFNGNDENGLVV